MKNIFLIWIGFFLFYSTSCVPKKNASEVNKAPVTTGALMVEPDVKTSVDSNKDNAVTPSSMDSAKNTMSLPTEDTKESNPSLKKNSQEQSQTIMSISTTKSPDEKLKMNIMDPAQLNDSGVTQIPEPPAIMIGKLLPPPAPTKIEMPAGSPVPTLSEASSKKMNLDNNKQKSDSEALAEQIKKAEEGVKNIKANSSSVVVPSTTTVVPFSPLTIQEQPKK